MMRKGVVLDGANANPTQKDRDQSKRWAIKQLNWPLRPGPGGGSVDKDVEEKKSFNKASCSQTPRGPGIGLFRSDNP